MKENQLVEGDVIKTHSASPEAFVVYKLQEGKAFGAYVGRSERGRKNTETYWDGGDNFIKIAAVKGISEEPGSTTFLLEKPSI